MRRMLEDKKNQNWRKEVELESDERIISHRVMTSESTPSIPNRLSFFSTKMN
jgi:hypothetical protein